MNFQEAWDFLDKLQFFKIKLGLDSMRTFLARLGNPDQGLKIVHIAGTNGKGSVGAMLHAMAGRAGYRCAFYTSPHLSSVRERFRIGDCYISEEAFARHAAEIVGVMGEDRITYFEFTTALALLWFAAEKVDLVILETGLGGRLDATNVVSPCLSVITNISMDHEAYLGDTLEEVAAEKAGIVKPGVPVVSGVTDPVAGEVVERFCRELEAPLYRLTRDFSALAAADGCWNFHGRFGEMKRLPLKIAGTHQIANAAVALAATECLSEMSMDFGEEAIRAGLAEVRWPCRLESLTASAPLCGLSAGARRRVLIDGAHNPAGASALAAALRESFPRKRLIVVWAAMADKDIGATLGEISPLADFIVLTRPEYERSATPEEIAGYLDAFKGEVNSANDVETALSLAFSRADGENDLVLVAGSLYLAGKAREIIAGGIV